MFEYIYIYIFREKQCSELINILIEFIAVFFAVSMKQRKLIFEIQKNNNNNT